MLSPKELAELTGIKLRTIVRLAHDKKLPAVKIGRQWRFVREDVERWLRTKGSNVRSRVLVVDDDEELLELMEVILETRGYEVVTARGGKEAVRVLENDTDFSLLVLDLQMPEVSGPDVLERVYEHEMEIPTLVITAYPESDLMDSALSYGPLTVLKKPFHPVDLGMTVDGILRGRTP